MHVWCGAWGKVKCLGILRPLHAHGPLCREPMSNRPDPAEDIRVVEGKNQPDQDNVVGHALSGQHGLYDILILRYCRSHHQAAVSESN